ncbi:LuxR C-terminal-related transcriptional regulator [Micromonospora polyrhachis]|uniref:LuxR family maltose regulon positive regulatory protein n=1 Tax=Micromonospora polyrhachis TaxID=1282883 RepID=A0A7W7SL64_9ACTN|nr:LuxR family transcriptional regulator [Micromonospora polyrhachis]MBB4956456.1 LuxR family maltose regulon positive regulatory protein [Micromonospora polyrhachis]
MIRTIRPRPALERRLESAAWQHRVTVVHAPAGWGKSLGLAGWAASSARRDRIARVDLDSDCAEPVVFWTRVTEALAGVDDRFAGLPPPPAGSGDRRSWIAELVATGRSAPADLVLALDNVERIDTPAVRDELALLVLGRSRIRLLLAGRTRPPIALARLRALGALAEIGTGDLGFSADEARSLLDGPATPEFEEAIRRAEGWPVALRFAAGQPHERLRGDHHHLYDYVVEEVLALLPAGLCRFLLGTAGLDWLSGPLCEAVTGGADGSGKLARLERAGVFVVPLDRRRVWFRYHPLFREALHRAAATEGVDTEDTHRRAGRWFVDHGMPDRAIAHLLAAGDEVEAGELIASTYWRMLDVGHITTVLGWIDRIAPAQLHADARLLLAHASASLFAGRTGEVHLALTLAEAAPVRQGPLADGLPSVAAGIALGRASLSALHGDVGEAVRWARRARSMHGPEHFTQRANCDVILAGSAYYAGPGDDVEFRLTEIVESATPMRNTVAEVAGRATLARVRAERGDLTAAGEQLARAEALIGSRYAAAPFTDRVFALCHAAVAQHTGAADVAVAGYANAHALAIAATDRITALDAALGLAELELDAGRGDAARRWSAEAGRLLAECEDPGQRLRTRQAAVRARLAERVAADPTAGGLVTARQGAILQAVARGLSDAAIAAELGVSVRTVHAHLRAVNARLRVHRRADAVRVYRAGGGPA